MQLLITESNNMCVCVVGITVGIKYKGTLVSYTHDSFSGFRHKG